MRTYLIFFSYKLHLILLLISIYCLLKLRTNIKTNIKLSNVFLFKKIITFSIYYSNTRTYTFIYYMHLTIILVIILVEHFH